MIAALIDEYVLLNLKKVKYVKREKDLKKLSADKKSELEVNNNTLKMYIKEINKLAD